MSCDLSIRKPVPEGPKICLRTYSSTKTNELFRHFKERHQILVTQIIPWHTFFKKWKGCGSTTAVPGAGVPSDYQ